MTLIDKTCRHTTHLTPEYILDRVRKYFDGDIEFDPATEEDNPTKALAFCAPPKNGLAEAWGNLRVFVNPPYGPELRLWARKIAEEAAFGAHVVALLPGQRFETDYWQKYIIGHTALTAVVWVRRRVAFLRPDGQRAVGNPYGSMLYVFNGSARRAAYAFGPIGLVTKLKVIARYTGR